MTEILMFLAFVVTAGLGYAIGYLLRGYQDEALVAEFLRTIADESERMKLELDLDD